MLKIPTVYVRSEEDRRYVTDEVTPGCEWVLAGEGAPTHKYDGTCVMFDGHFWWSRREVKKGKAVPDHFEEINFDEVTGKRIGYEPIRQSGFHRWFEEAITNWVEDDDFEYPLPGTYELCGPKINGNPERLIRHELRSHKDAETVHQAQRRHPWEIVTVALLSRDPKRMVQAVSDCWSWEGLVWHHENGLMAKLKARDLAP